MTKNTKPDNPVLSLVITSGLTDLSTQKAATDLKHKTDEGNDSNERSLRTLVRNDTDTDLDNILFNLHKKVHSSGVIPCGTIAPIVISLLLIIILAVPEGVNGIKKIITGGSLQDTDKQDGIIVAINLLEENSFTVLTN